MTSRSGQLVLGLTLFPAGNRGRWREPDSRAEEAFTFAVHREIAQKAEAARVDYVFIADGPNHDAANFPSNPFRFLEALTVMSSLVGVTSHIGLIPTLSTTYFEPYNLARQIASLDHLSSGRAGWNVVTSFGGAAHFGTSDLLAHDTRYERAEEFLDVVDLFWRSWGEDALVIDRESGRWGDPDRVFSERYRGTHFQVDGPLNLPRSPQGRPVISQAGGSESGTRLGSRTADLVFNVGTSKRSVVANYEEIKIRAEGYGRSRADIKVLVGYGPIIGATESEAREIAESLVDLVGYDEGLGNLGRSLGGIDLSDLAPDDLFPLELIPDPATSNGVQTIIKGLANFVIDERPTVKQLVNASLLGIGGNTGGLRSTGTVTQIADSMVEFFKDGAADGFVLGPSGGLSSYDAITDQLIPELQDRGVFPSEYEGSTFRENLGLGISQ